MAATSGYEDYVTYIDSAPAVALTRARSHQAWLLARLNRARTSGDGISTDFSTARDALDIVERHIADLRAATQPRMQARLIPLRRRR